jgi:hypothetical protein
VYVPVVDGASCELVYVPVACPARLYSMPCLSMVCRAMRAPKGEAIQTKDSLAPHEKRAFSVAEGLQRARDGDSSEFKYKKSEGILEQSSE